MLNPINNVWSVKRYTLCVNKYHYKMQVLMITYTQIIYFHTQQIFKVRPVLDLTTE